MRVDFVPATYWRAPKTTRIRLVLGLRRIVFAAPFLLLFGLAPMLAQASPTLSFDPCHAFLSSGSIIGSTDNARLNPVGNKHAAGKATTLSLLLGVRHALGPVEDLNRANVPATQTQDVTALDIMRYRSCKKEQALRISLVR